MLWLAILIGCASPDGEMDTPVDPDSDTFIEADTEAARPWPATLSETGLYDDIVTGTLAAGVRTYEPAFPLWSDGADKERYLALPDGAQIDTSDPDFWDFPVGTRAWKTFIRDGVRVETRYIERVDDEWIWISYQWRGDGSDADAVPDGVTDANGTEHDIPFEGACFRCHQATGLLGVDAIQLGDDNAFGTLDEWTTEGLFTDPIDQATSVPGEGLEHDVIGYLHGNCGGCHNDRYFLADAFALRMRHAVGTVSVQDTAVYRTGLNAPTRHQNSTSVVIAPGDPDASQLVERMATRDVTQMPPTGTELVDHDTLDDIRDWIASLPTD